MIESCHFISQINLMLWNTCSCPCPLWDLRIALRIRTRTSRMLCIALRTRIRTSRFFNVTDDTLQIPCFAYGHGHVSVSVLGPSLNALTRPRTAII